MSEQKNDNAKFDNAELAKRVQDVIDSQINPALAGHGGFVTLVEVTGTKVSVELGGGCHGCMAAAATMQAGVTAMIKDAVPEVTEVVDATDHATGTNPFCCD
ncbi:MAG: NifU family protein [Pseudomonadota bacterium]